MRHAAYPESFGLLYGETTKTACGKRRKTVDLVSRDETTCAECLARWLRWDAEQEAIRVAALSIAQEEGYPSIESWIEGHR